MYMLFVKEEVGVEGGRGSKEEDKIILLRGGLWFKGFKGGYKNLFLIE